MEMESAKLCGLLAASFLFLTLLADPTAACGCPPPNAVKAYCSSDPILKAQVLGATIYRQKSQRMYKIKVTKVMKGSKMLQKYQYLFTPFESRACGYEHPTHLNKDEYVFTVMEEKDILITSRCHFNKKWDRLSEEDKKGIEGGFKEECD